MAGSIAAVNPVVQVLAVGAAAPAWRLPASEVAAAWGRSGGKGQAAVCAPDEDVLTLAAEAARRALAASGLQTDIVDGLWWGTTRPPFAEGPSHPVLARAIGLSHRSTGALCSGSPHAGHGGTTRRSRRGRRGLSTGCPGRRRIGRARSWASAPGSRHVRAPARRQSSSVGTAAARRSAPGSRRTHPFLDRYRGDDESRHATSTTLGSSAKRCSSPPCASSPSSSRRSTCARGRSPIPTDGSARRRQAARHRRTRIDQRVRGAR